VTIEGVVHDEEIKDRWLFQGTSGGKRQAFIIRPFSNDESHNYANILCEVHFAEVAAKLNSQFIARLKDNFVVQTGIEMDEPNSHVLVFEPLDASLAQVIRYRRRNRWDWSEAEFDRFLRDLVWGLDELHRAGISHNDIRPDSVFFSVASNCYLLANFANCQKGTANAASSGARPDQRFSAPEASQQHEVDLLKGDVYSLGLTLLSAFYLCQHVDRRLFVAQNKLLEGKYSSLAIIEQMIAPVEQRPSIAEIKARLPPSDYKYESMGQLVDSMQHRERPTPEETAASKMATGWAYQRLGLWNEWKKEY
jgi:serine/threonine protein kinase